MPKSIISNERRCLVCGRTEPLHLHHVYMGGNRRNADRFGCWVYLCARHHTSTDGVHFNRELDLKLKRMCQRKFEELYSHEKFMEVFGKNYL